MQPTDTRVDQARAYLASARKQPLHSLPQAVLVCLAAELRRNLGQVLDVIAERPDGLSDEQRDVVAAALRDALEYDDLDGYGLCNDRAATYRALAASLGIDVEAAS